MSQSSMSDTLPRPLFSRRMISLLVVVLSLFSLAGVAATTFLAPSHATKAAPKAVSNPVPFGMFLGFQFVDLVKQSARFQQIGSAPALTYDSAGWPQSDFEYIFLDARRNMPWDGPDFNGVNPPDVAGTYHLSFTGQATLVSEEDPNALQFQNVKYNSSTNTTTADVVLLPNHWLAAIGFTNTKRNPGDTAGDGITNVSLLRPGYAPGTTQVFTTEFINALNQVHPYEFRSFDNGINSYNIWNGTTLVDVKWSDRSLPSDAYWPLSSRNSGAARGLAVPWEYYILLANQIHSGLWINLPVGADDDYVKQLATLIKNGDQWTPGLASGLPVYVEYSNEVWNWSFSQSIYNDNIAKKEGISDIQRYVERTFQVSDLFRSVYGDAAMGSTIRTVAQWQYNTDLDMQGALTWAQGKFGNPPNHYLYGIGEAPYVDPTEHGTAPYPDPADPNGVKRIMDTFYTSAGNRRRAFEQWQTVATNFGLHETGYESGPSLGAGIEADVTRDPRMADFIPRYFLNDYFATGADAVNFFALGPGVPCGCGDWYAFEDYSTMNNYGKWKGVLATAGQARPAIDVGNVLPWSVNDSVTIDASQYVNGGSFAAPGSTAATCAGGCWPYPGSLDYMLRAPANGTYAISLTGHTNNAAAQIQVQVDNSTVNTVTLPQSTDGTVSVGSVTLTAGQHTLVLNGAGTGQTTFATNGGISISLSSGGGSAIVPSAPINVINSVNDGQVTVKWENVTEATGYTIERSTTSGGPYTTIGNATTNSYTDTGLTNGTTYYYVVTANNSAGSSPISPQTAAVPTQAVAPATPGNINAQAGAADSTPFNAGGQVRISWDPVPNATSYNIKQYDSGSSSYKTIRTQTETIFYQDNLTQGTTYKYEISAVNSFGESANTAEIDLTPTETAPAAPTNLTATAGDGQVSLKWMQSQWQFPSFGSLFNVKRGTSATGPFTTVLSLSTNNAVDLGLTGGTQYCYVVTAVNSKGESANSNAVCATPTSGSGGGSLVTAINSGGGAAGSFVADANYSGGSAYSNSDTIDTSGVSNPAPAAVYQSERYGNFSYTVGGLTAGATYTVRLHFAEIYWNAAGQRVFNVSINGSQVLSNFDIYATAGAKDKAVVETFSTTADSSGTITIQYSTVKDNAKSSGIEILSSSLVTAINSGGSAAGSFVADTGYSGGSTANNGDTIDTSGVSNPAPQAVYQSERYGNFTYTIGGLTAGASYTVRLHFAEIYWNGAGQRVFNVSINGAQVLSNFDIYATTGGKDKAVVETFSATADSNGKITIQYSTVKDNAKSSGIEILS